MSSKTIKEFYKENVTKEGMMEEDVRKSNSTFYTNNFEAVSRWRKKYLSEYAPIPEFKTNIYIYGPGGIGKTVASQAAAKKFVSGCSKSIFSNICGNQKFEMV